MTDKKVSNIGSNLVAAALLPGLPHLLRPELNDSYKALNDAMTEVGDSFASRGVKRVIYYSTQWLSVLGQSFQGRERLKGLHVDENWHELSDLPFEFRVDASFAHTLAATSEKEGFQSKVIDFEGFPVDTGTIVADSLINKGRFVTNMVASCVYTDGEATENLAGLISKEIEKDSVPTAIVCVSGLSGRWFTTEIDLREDHIRSQEDDVWNKKILADFESGAFDKLDKVTADYAGACKVDMGFKAYHFLKGAGACKQGYGANLRAYGAVYGTGNAVLEF